jgi:hypothetical protein
MIDFIHEGGWPMYFVFAFGAASLAAALHYQKTLRREFLAVVIGLAVATIFVGVLGTVLGVQKSASAIGEVDHEMKWIFLLGLKESLNNLVAALGFAVVNVLLTTRGAFRAARLSPSRV